MIREELYQKLNIGENSEIEFKSAKGGLPKSLWSSLSAFANTAGGYIILGIEEIEGLFELGSLKNPKVMLKQFWDTHNNSEKLNYPICKEDNISILEIENISVIIIYVPIASREERPIYLNTNPYKGTYKRSYEGDYRCSKDEINQMLRDASVKAQDGNIVEDFGLNDVDSETLKSYKNRFRTRHSDHPYLALDDKELLIKIGAYRRDRKSKIEGLTLAGLMIFGKESSIMEAFPYFHLDYQEQLSDSEEERWSYRITQDGTWECNIYNFYYRVYNRIIQDIEVPFALESDGTRIGETHVHEAIREVMVNTLIHADHKTSKSIVIVKSKNIFQFTNPGRYGLIGEEYRDLNKLQRLILIMAHQFSSVKNEEITSYTTEHPRDVGEVLRQMVNKGWLLSNGIGRGMNYRLNQAYLYENQMGGQASTGGGQAKGQAENSSDTKSNITASEWNILRSLGEGDKSAKELKSSQSKGISGAFKERLSNLMEKGMIAYMIPDKPTSPKQRYRLTENGMKIVREQI